MIIYKQLYFTWFLKKQIEKEFGNNSSFMSGIYFHVVFIHFFTPIHPFIKKTKVSLFYPPLYNNKVADFLVYCNISRIKYYQKTQLS